MICIGIGSNQYSADKKSPKANCQEALRRLNKHQIFVDRTSSFFESSPVPDTQQPWYVNAVASVKTKYKPIFLLKNLLTIEADMGRIRTVRNGPRVIDLDLLSYDDQILEMGGLILPHPRMTERAFVLKPLAEIAPDWYHPLSRATQCICVNSTSWFCF